MFRTINRNRYPAGDALPIESIEDVVIYNSQTVVCPSLGDGESASVIYLTVYGFRRLARLVVPLWTDRGSPKKG